MAGANAVSTTVNGIGERAGNTPLEELIMTLKIIYDVDLGFNISKFYELSKLVESLTNMKIPDNKPIVGKNIFRHESGIHVDAVIEEPLTYEPFLPELIGHQRRIVLGTARATRAPPLPALTIRPAIKFIRGEPMNPATNWLSGEV